MPACAFNIAQPQLTILTGELRSQIDAEDEEAKRFDLLMLRLQLTVLRAEPGFERLRRQVQQIAGLLAEQAAIPMVKHEMQLIEAMRGDE